MPQPETTFRPCLCVFAGSGTPTDPAVMEAAEKLGARIAEAGYALVYGGGTGGVMGAVALAAHKAGGKVIAVTHELYAAEPQVPGAEVVLVADEQARFRRFAACKPVAYFALPGGPGALREALQGLEDAVYAGGPPVVLVKVKDYLDGIKQYFDLALQGGMIKAAKKDCLKLWSADENLEDVLGRPSPAAEAAPKASPSI